MDPGIHVLLSVPRFSIGARSICMQKAKELEEAVALVRKEKGLSAAELEFHYAEKLHAMSFITNYLLDPASNVTDAEFVELVGLLEYET